MIITFEKHINYIRQQKFDAHDCCHVLYSGLTEQLCYSHDDWLSFNSVRSNLSILELMMSISPYANHHLLQLQAPKFTPLISNSKTSDTHVNIVLNYILHEHVWCCGVFTLGISIIDVFLFNHYHLTNRRSYRFQSIH